TEIFEWLQDELADVADLPEGTSTASRRTKQKPPMLLKNSLQRKGLPRRSAFALVSAAPASGVPINPYDISAVDQLRLRSGYRLNRIVIVPELLFETTTSALPCAVHVTDSD